MSRSFSDVFAEQAALGEMLLGFLEVHATPGVQRLSTRAPLQGPLYEHCRSLAPDVDWFRFFEQLERQSESGVLIEPFGELRSDNGLVFVGVERPEHHKNLVDLGPLTTADVVQAVENHRRNQPAPDVHGLVSGGTDRQTVYVRVFEPHRFPRFNMFVASQGIADRGVPAPEWDAWLAGLKRGVADRWARSWIRSMHEHPRLRHSRWLHGSWRFERRGDRVHRDTIEMFGAFDDAFVYARQADPDDPRDRRLLRRLARR